MAAFIRYDLREAPANHTPDSSVSYLLSESALKHKPITNARALECLSLYRQTSETRYRDEILHGHLRMILSVSRKMCPPAIPLADIVQECVIGFLNGLDKFDIDKKPKPGQLPAKVSSVAIMYARKEAFLFLDETANTVFLGTRPQKAARKGAKLMEAAAREHETNTVAIDIILADMSPSARLGAIEVQANNFPPGAPGENEDEFEEIADFTAAPGDYEFPDHPEEAPGPDSNPVDYHHLQHICRCLDDRERDLLFSHYRLITEPFDTICNRHAISQAEGTRSLYRSIQKIKGQQEGVQLLFQ